MSVKAIGLKALRLLNGRAAQNPFRRRTLEPADAAEAVYALRWREIFVVIVVIAGLGYSTYPATLKQRADKSNYRIETNGKAYRVLFKRRFWSTVVGDNLDSAEKAVLYRDWTIKKAEEASAIENEKWTEVKDANH